MDLQQKINQSIEKALKEDKTFNAFILGNKEYYELKTLPQKYSVINNKGGILYYLGYKILKVDEVNHFSTCTINV